VHTRILNGLNVLTGIQVSENDCIKLSHVYGMYNVWDLLMRLADNDYEFECSDPAVKRLADTFAGGDANTAHIEAKKDTNKAIRLFSEYVVKNRRMYDEVDDMYEVAIFTYSTILGYQSDKRRRLESLLTYLPSISSRQVDMIIKLASSIIYPHMGQTDFDHRVKHKTAFLNLIEAFMSDEPYNVLSKELSKFKEKTNYHTATFLSGIISALQPDDFMIYNKGSANILIDNGFNLFVKYKFDYYYDFNELYRCIRQQTGKSLIELSVISNWHFYYGRSEIDTDILGNVTYWDNLNDVSYKSCWAAAQCFFLLAGFYKHSLDGFRSSNLSTDKGLPRLYKHILDEDFSLVPKLLSGMMKTESERMTRSMLYEGGKAVDYILKKFDGITSRKAGKRRKSGKQQPNPMTDPKSYMRYYGTLSFLWLANWYGPLTEDPISREFYMNKYLEKPYKYVLEKDFYSALLHIDFILETCLDKKIQLMLLEGKQSAEMCVRFYDIQY